MFLILHIPSGQFLWNPCLNTYWGFRYKRIADQLVDPKCPVNVLEHDYVIHEANPQVDWTNATVDEFEIVEVANEIETVSRSESKT